MYLPLAIFSTLVGMAATFFMLILLLAGSPNSSPQQLSQIKWLMISVTAVGLLGLAAAIWTMCLQRYGLAAAIGFAPAVVVMVIFIILLKTQG